MTPQAPRAVRPDTSSVPAPAPCAEDAPSSTIAGMSAGWRILFIVGAAALTLLVCVLVGGHRWDIGIPGEWVWPYYDTPQPWQIAAPALILASLMLALLYLAVRRRIEARAQEIVLLALVLLFAMGIILNLGEAGPGGAYEAMPVTTVTWIGGYYAESLRVGEMGRYLAGYADHITQFRVDDRIYGHISDHPVGPVLFHWLVNQAMETWPSLARLFIPENPETNAAIHAMAQQAVRGPISEGAFAGIWASAWLYRMSFWLMLVPLYALARQFYTRETALLGVALAALIPSLHLFGPYPDQIFPLFVVFGLYALVRALRGGSAWWGAAAGATMFVGLNWSLSLLAGVALLGFAGALLRWRQWRQEGAIRHKTWILPAMGAIAAFLAGILIAGALFGYDVVRVWRVSLAQHATFADLFPRSYGAWALFNPVEFAVFLGVPAALLALLAAGADLREAWRAGWRHSPSVLLWSVVGVLLALNLSGKNLGEVARLWMMLMPPVALVAADALCGLDRGRGRIAVLFIAMTTVQLVVFRLNLNVFTV